MIKIRLTGLPAELEETINEMKKHFHFFESSKEYKDRNSKYMRKYADIEKRGNENE